MWYSKAFWGEVEDSDGVQTSAWVISQAVRSLKMKFSGSLRFQGWFTRSFITELPPSKSYKLRTALSHWKLQVAVIGNTPCINISYRPPLWAIFQGCVQYGNVQYLEYICHRKLYPYFYLLHYSCSCSYGGMRPVSPPKNCTRKRLGWLKHWITCCPCYQDTGPCDGCKDISSNELFVYDLSDHR